MSDHKKSNSNEEKSFNKILKDYEENINEKNDTINFNPNQKRWEYLYELNKLKKIKKQCVMEIYCKEDIKKKLSECTFSPKINKKYNDAKYSKITKYNSPSSKLDKENSYLKPTIMSTYSSNSKISGNKSKEIKNLTDYGILERQIISQESKNLKVKFLKSQKEEREFEECNFSPKLVINFHNLRIPLIIKVNVTVQLEPQN